MVVRKIGSLCDAASRWELSRSGTAQHPTWVDSTGGDTLTSVALTETAVYVGGHQRWVNNHFGTNDAQPGYVDRKMVAALDPTTGLPLSWNPAVTRGGSGIYDMLATPDGLWLGSDDDIAFPGHKKLVFFPLTGGSRVPDVQPQTLPRTVYTTTSGNGLLRRSYDGTTFGTSSAVPSPRRGLVGLGQWCVHALRVGVLRHQRRVASQGVLRGAQKVLTVQVTGVAGVPADATAVVLNLTAVGATLPTYVTAWPAGSARPTTSNLNVHDANPVPNTAVVPVGAGGAISLFSSSGSVNLLADITGYFAPGTASEFTAVGPCRVFDTRFGTGSCSGAHVVAKTPLGAQKVLTVQVTGVAGVPADATAVVLNLTAVGATLPTYVTAWPRRSHRGCP